MRICSVEECGRPVKHREWCGAHYKRWRRHGDPRKLVYRRGWTLEQRFWDQVQKADGCWLWTGGTDREGYGTISAGGGRATHIGAHQASWIIHFGQPPAGLEVCHTCNVPACVRPDHLYLDTHAGNMAYMAQCGRAPATVHPERMPRGDQHWTRRRRQEPSP